MRFSPETIKCPSCGKWSKLASSSCGLCKAVIPDEIIQARKDEIKKEADAGKKELIVTARMLGILFGACLLILGPFYIPVLLETPSQRAEREKNEQAEAKAKEKAEEEKLKAAEEEANKWVPEGFAKHSDNQEMAFRYTKESCDKGEYCQKVEVVSKNNCSSIYGEVALLDNNDRNVGFTNDIAAGVEAGQVALLEFYTYEEGFSTWRITELNCN